MFYNTIEKVKKKNKKERKIIDFYTAPLTHATKNTIFYMHVGYYFCINNCCFQNTERKKNKMKKEKESERESIFHFNRHFIVLFKGLVPAQQF